MPRVMNFIEREDTRNLPRREGKRERDTIHPILRVHLTARQKHLTLIVSQIHIYLHLLMSALQVMTGEKGERNLPKRIGINTVKGGISVVIESGREGIRNLSTSQEGLLNLLSFRNFFTFCLVL